MGYLFKCLSCTFSVIKMQPYIVHENEFKVRETTEIYKKGGKHWLSLAGFKKQHKFKYLFISEMDTYCRKQWMNKDKLRTESLIKVSLWTNKWQYELKKKEASNIFAEHKCNFTLSTSTPPFIALCFPVLYRYYVFNKLKVRPSAKRLGLALMWYLFYCCGLEQNLHCIQGMPVPIGLVNPEKVNRAFPHHLCRINDRWLCLEGWYEF